ncbi:hypothetical protein [Thalassobaculum sp.]|uniref:hypothetical protein n=1 Tax=Thalassobaculum sp. TaxID=2022740 RepID=UPI0032EEFAF1
MNAVTASMFCRKFGSYQRKVQQGPIEVSSHGQVTGYFLSPEEFERYQMLSAAVRRAYHPSELPDHLKRAVQDARMDPKHDHLNALLDDE